MTIRALAVAVTLVAALVTLGLVLEDPGIVGTAADKVAEGGMWTALAAFILVAAVLGYGRRDASGRRPPRGGGGQTP